MFGIYCNFPGCIAQLLFQFFFADENIMIQKKNANASGPARGIQGLSDSLHKFLSFVLIMCFFLGLHIAIRGMLFVILLTLFLDADAIAAFTSTKLHKMARSVPAYLLVFLLFSLPLAPIHLILCILLVPWVDLLLGKIASLMPAQTHWSEVTVLADDFIALQSLTFFGTPGTVLDVRGASNWPLL